MKKITLFLIWSFLYLNTLHNQIIDTTFNPNFTTVGVGSKVITQPDGKILVTGNFSLIGEIAISGIARLLPDGNVDTSFQYKQELFPVNNLVLQADGKIIISGKVRNGENQYVNTILRLLPNGTLDTSFQQIKDNYLFFLDMEILPNQKIYLAYYDYTPTHSSNFGIRLYGKDGQIDESFPNITFKTSPLQSYPTAGLSDIAVQSNNALIAAGTEMGLDTFIQTVYRFDSTGAIDLSFDPKIPSVFNNLTVQNMDVLPDGTMGFLGGGEQNITVLDSMGNHLFTQIFKNNNALLKATQENSFLVVGEQVIHIYPNGNFETIANGANGQVLGMAAQSEGMIITGWFNEVEEHFTPGIYRYIFPTAIPKYDETFKAKFYKLGTVNSLIIQNSGKIVAGGNFNFVNGQQINHLARLNPDGSLDSTFNSYNINITANVNELKALSDESIIVGGRYDAKGISNTSKGLSILDKDGNYLRTIAVPLFGSNPSYLAIDSEDKVYMGGGTAYLLEDANGKESGQILMQYQFNGPFINNSTNYNYLYIDGLYRFNGLTMQLDNKLLIYGNQITYDGSDTTSIVRAQITGERDTTFKAALPANFYSTNALTIDSHFIFIAGRTGRHLVDGFFAKLEQNGELSTDYSTKFSGEINTPLVINYLGHLPNDWVLVNGNFNQYENSSIPSGKLMMKKTNELIGEFLPTLENIIIKDMASMNSSSLYLAGTFVNPNGGGGVIKIEQLPISTPFKEEIFGDLSDSIKIPTIIQLSGISDSITSCQQGEPRDVDYFTFNIPHGYVLSELQLINFTTINSNNNGFIGIQRGTSFSIAASEANASDLLGGLTYGTANIGTNILPQMGQLEESQRFTAPLKAGNYIIWLNQTGEQSCATFKFTITPSEECLENLIFNNQTILAGTYTISNTITTNGQVLLANDSSVVLEAGKAIILNPGFHATKETIFIAQIESCENDILNLATVEKVRLNQRLDNINTTLFVRPNPFRQSTIIEYTIETSQAVNLIIYNLNGQIVKRLVNSAIKEKGKHSCNLDRTNLKAGMYLAVLTTEKERLSQKIILLD